VPPQVQIAHRHQTLPCPHLNLHAVTGIRPRIPPSPGIRPQERLQRLRNILLEPRRVTGKQVPVLLRGMGTMKAHREVPVASQDARLAPRRSPAGQVDTEGNDVDWSPRHLGPGILEEPAAKMTPASGPQGIHELWGQRAMIEPALDPGPGQGLGICVGIGHGRVVPERMRPPPPGLNPPVACPNTTTPLSSALDRPTLQPCRTDPSPPAQDCGSPQP
jgi:hypothetical protein